MNTWDKWTVVPQPKKGRSASSAGKGPGRRVGAAPQHWETFLEHARVVAPEAEVVWKTYAGKTGTQCVFRTKDRNLAYLKPAEGSFLVSVALSDASIAGLEASELPKALIAEIKVSPKYPEGTPARVRVDSAKSLEHALVLLSIKVADTAKGKPRRQ